MIFGDIGERVFWFPKGLQNGTTDLDPPAPHNVHTEGESEVII